jgi:hypothetical protein
LWMSATGPALERGRCSSGSQSGRRSAAMNAKALANRSISIPRSSAGSLGSGTASLACAQAREAVAQAGRRCTLPSMCNQVAYTEVLPDEKKGAVIAFLSRSMAFFKANGVIPERIMTGNGSAYRSAAFRNALQGSRLRHIRTRPYTPRTNGKAEHFIQTSLCEWAYAAPYETSDERASAMIPFIGAYNTERLRSALAFQTPWQRLNNLSRKRHLTCRPESLKRLTLKENGARRRHRPRGYFRTP